MRKSILAVLTISVTAVACGAKESSPVTDTPEAVSKEAVRPAKPSARAASSAAGRSGKTAAQTSASVVPEYREFVVPAGTTLSLTLNSAVGSEVSQVEDTVRATLLRTIRIDGHEVLPVGTEFHGVVTGAQRAGRVKGRSRVTFRFSSLRFAGEHLSVQTASIERIGEATKGEDATKIGVGAGAGAVIGGLLGGKGGAAKGAVVGGAAGTGVVMATRGRDVLLAPGSEVFTNLTAPLTVHVSWPASERTRTHRAGI